MEAAARSRIRRRSGPLLRAAADERLVARMRAGDDAAFEALYDRHHRELLAFCRHMLGSRDEAEDALQHSFAAAYRALRDGGDDVALGPWLYTIARNRCLSTMRARREVPTGDADESARLDGLDAQVQRRTELRDLVDDLQRLPEGLVREVGYVEQQAPVLHGAEQRHPL